MTSDPHVILLDDAILETIASRLDQTQEVTAQIEDGDLAAYTLQFQSPAERITIQRTLAAAQVRKRLAIVQDDLNSLDGALIQKQVTEQSQALFGMKKKSEWTLLSFMRPVFEAGTVTMRVVSMIDSALETVLEELSEVLGPGLVSQKYAIIGAGPTRNAEPEDGAARTPVIQVKITDTRSLDLFKEVLKRHLASGKTFTLFVADDPHVVEILGDDSDGEIVAKTKKVMTHKPPPKRRRGS